MTDLLERCRTAGPDEARIILEKGFSELCRRSNGWGVGGKDFDAWLDKLSTFRRLTEINTEPALIGAALMLVPEGWIIDHLSDIGAAGGSCAHIGNPGTGAQVIEDLGARCLSLAILAAVLSAQAPQPVSVSDIGEDEEVGR